MVGNLGNVARILFRDSSSILSKKPNNSSNELAVWSSSLYFQWGQSLLPPDICLLFLQIMEKHLNLSFVYNHFLIYNNIASNFFYWLEIICRALFALCFISNLRYHFLVAFTLSRFLRALWEYTATSIHKSLTIL